MKLQVYNFRTKSWETKDVEMTAADIAREEVITSTMDSLQLFQYQQAWISIINTINTMEEGNYV